MKEKELPYFVEVGNNGCNKCGNNRTYDVIDPNGYAVGTSYSLEKDAEDMAESLNTAYEIGKNNRSKRKKDG